MRLLTANLRDGRGDASALRALLQRERIDVACFQELGPAQVEAIRAVLPHGVLDPGSGPSRYLGMGIAARSPLEVWRLPLTARPGFVAELSAEAWGLERPLELLNVHVLVPVGRQSWRIPLLRRHQVSELLAHLDATPRQPRLLLGDLNSTAPWPVYRALTSRLRDLHLEAARAAGGKPASTWGLWPGAPRLLRLDHALGHGIEGARVRLVDLEGSDHAGLVVEL